MKKKIVVSMGNISDLKTYFDKFNETLHKCENEIREEVADALVDELDDRYNGDIESEVDFVINKDGSKTYKSIKPNVSVSKESSTDKTLVRASGKDVMFIEFGAGVYFNGSVGSSPNKYYAKKFPQYTIGSYGKGYGKYEYWGYYDKNGDLVLTHGTKASKPIYHGVRRIRKQIEPIVTDIWERHFND